MLKSPVVTGRLAPYRFYLEPKAGGIDRPVPGTLTIASVFRQLKVAAAAAAAETVTILLGRENVKVGPDHPMRLVVIKARPHKSSGRYRYFKHLPGCRHRLSRSQNGIELQVCCAII
jgi:hypothetical protein